MSAILKHHVRRSVNSGMNAATPQEFAECATRQGGVVNTTVMIGHLSEDHDSAGREIKGITEFNYFAFEEDGVRVKKHSNIGSGKLLFLEEVEMPQKFHYEIWEGDEAKRRTYKPFKPPGTKETIPEGDSAKEGEQRNLNQEEEEEGELFQCPNELCDKSFKTNEERNEHCLSKQCSLTVQEAVSKLWTSKFSVKMFGNLSPQEKNTMAFFLTPLDVVRILDDIPRLLLDFEPDFSEGFALRRRKPNKKFTQDQEAFVKAEFDKGEIDKSKKVSAEMVVMLMRRATIPDPKKPGQDIYRFQKSDWLTESQVKGLYGKFDRLRTEKGKKATVEWDENSLAANYDHHAYHEEISVLLEKANEVQPVEEQDHPFYV